MVWWLIAAGLLVAAVCFWDDITEVVSTWLRSVGWDKSFLMDAWVILDRYMGKIRGHFFARDNYNQKIHIEEKVYDWNEIDDPEIQAELQRRGRANVGIMEHIQ